MGGKTLQEHFREQAELIDRRFIYHFGEFEKRWEAKVDRKLGNFERSLEYRLIKKFEAILDARFGAVDDRLEVFDDRFKAVDVRFDTIDKRFKKVDERFDAIDKRFDKVDERFESIEGTLKIILRRLPRTRLRRK